MVRPFADGESVIEYVRPLPFGSENAEPARVASKLIGAPTTATSVEIVPVATGGRLSTGRTGSPPPQATATKHAVADAIRLVRRINLRRSCPEDAALSNIRIIPLDTRRRCFCLRPSRGQGTILSPSA